MALGFGFCAAALVQEAPAAEKAQVAAAEKLLGGTFRAGAPGVATLVAVDGRVIYRGNFGQANTKTRAAIQSDTVFDIGSISKPFTATAILMLFEEGKLSIDDPLAKHLPELQRYPAGITLRHLLTHTSGLPHFEPDEERTGQQFLPEEILAWHARQKKLRFTPGEKYEYCNGGYVLLSLIVERIAGQPFPEFVRQRIFQPLGMTRTSLRLATRQIENRAVGYRRSNDAGFLVVSDSDGLRVQGDGGIQSTVEDLLRWAEAWTTAKLLKPETIRMALTPAVLNDGTRTSYGLGWGLSRVEGRVMVSHDGRARGFRAYLAMFPASRGALVVVVLGNQREIETGEVALKLAHIFTPGS